MRREKSCGAVIFAPGDGERLWLLEYMRKGHVSLCKGHMEAGETEHDTARREIGEETALSVRFLGSFRQTVRYSPYPGCTKLVVFFLARAESMDAVPQPEEVDSIRWLPYEKALAALTYDDDRRVLAAAEAYLQTEEGSALLEIK